MSEYKTELFISDEVFLTGTAAKIAPIKKIETTELNNERPIMIKLRNLLNTITENKSEHFHHWITSIDLRD